MTLDELKKAQGVASAPVTTVKESIHPMALPWWVVVLSNKPNTDGSPRFKFDFGFTTKEEAETRCKERQEAENRRAAELNLRKMRDAENRGADLAQIIQYTPLQFFVIERPAGGKL